MKTKLHYSPLLILLLMAASCTYTRLPSKLWLSRTGDTLTVALDPEAEARWNPESDSLIVLCQGCDPGRSTVVEHFDDRNYARYEIAHTQGLNLTLYSQGHKDTVFVMSGEGVRDTNEAAPSIRKIPHRRRNSDEDVENNTPAPPKKVKTHEATKDVTKETTTQEKKTLIKPTILKVVATEGVAVYKDKSKKEVLEIVPAGSTLQLISREGDMYSVAVGDGEGFVEAETVQVQ